MTQWTPGGNQATGAELSARGREVFVAYGGGQALPVHITKLRVEDDGSLSDLGTASFPSTYYTATPRFLSSAEAVYWEFRGETPPYETRYVFVDLDTMVAVHEDESEFSTDKGGSACNARDGFITEQGDPPRFFVNGVRWPEAMGEGQTAGGYVVAAPADNTNSLIKVRWPDGSTRDFPPHTPVLGKFVEQAGWLLYGGGRSRLLNLETGDDHDVSVRADEGIGCLVRVEGDLWVANHQAVRTLIRPVGVTDKTLPPLHVNCDRRLRAVAVDHWLVVAGESAGVLIVQTQDSRLALVNPDAPPIDPPPVDPPGGPVTNEDIMDKLVQMEGQIAELEAVASAAAIAAQDAKQAALVAVGRVTNAPISGRVAGTLRLTGTLNPEA